MTIDIDFENEESRKRFEKKLDEEIKKNTSVRREVCPKCKCVFYLEEPTWLAGWCPNCGRDEIYIQRCQKIIKKVKDNEESFQEDMK